MPSLSPAELSYIRTSLESNPPVRPDARGVTQFRPLQASTNFLPTANGSARVRTADGSECIVGVKAKVTQLDSNSIKDNNSYPIEKLVAVDVDIAGLRDDHVGATLISSTLQQMLVNSQILNNSNRLKLTSKFAFKLHVDALVMSHSASNPLNLLSLTIYLALMSTKLPKLISSTDDSAAEEIPVFDDDWDNAIPLTNSRTNDNLYYKPPLLFIFAVVGENLLIDPSKDEEIVSEGGILMGWENGKITAPLRFMELSSGRSKGIKPHMLNKAYKLAVEAGNDVSESLDLIAKLDKEDELEYGPPSMF